MISALGSSFPARLPSWFPGNFRLEIEPCPVSGVYLQAIHVDGAPNLFLFSGLREFAT